MTWITTLLPGWVSPSVNSGLMCSPDGMMAVVCSFLYIRSYKDALVWAALTAAFHLLFGGTAAFLTGTSENTAILIIRIAGIALTGWFLKSSIKEALATDVEDENLPFGKILVTTAVVGSIDAASFGHGSAVAMMGKANIAVVISSWLISSVIVGVLTMATALMTLKGRSLVKTFGTPFLVLGAILRVGLFVGLLAMLSIDIAKFVGLLEADSYKGVIVVLAITSGALMFMPTLRAQKQKK